MGIEQGQKLGTGCKWKEHLLDLSHPFTGVRRSLHDALCVIRCLVNKRFLIAGGSSPEMEINLGLSAWAKTLTVGGAVTAVLALFS